MPPRRDIWNTLGGSEMATLRELKERTRSLRAEGEQIHGEVLDYARRKRPRGYGTGGGYTVHQEDSGYRGRYGDFLREFAEAQWSGSEVEEARVLKKHLNKLTRLGVTQDNALRLLQNAWERHRIESGSGEVIYEDG